MAQPNCRQLQRLTFQMPTLAACSIPVVNPEQPVTHWTPSLAVCAIDFYVGDRFPGWRHDLFVSSLAAEELVRLEIESGKVVHQEVLFKGIGRVRDVVTGPDGYVYVSLEPGRIARLAPAVGAVQTR